MKYTEEHHEFIRSIAPGKYNDEIAEEFNEKFQTSVTAAQIKSYKGNYKIKSNVPRAKKGSQKELFSEEQKTFVRKNVAGTSNKKLTDLVNEHFKTNFTQTQVKGWKKNHKLDSGLSGRFEKGNIPFNKGKKGMGGWEPTQFKKGSRPHNYMPVGSERVNSYGYIQIKIADPNKWKNKHHIIWEKVNGEIPKGHVIVFADGDRKNLDISNLILVTKRQMLYLNRHNMIYNDSALTKTSLTIAKLHHKAYDLEKGKNLKGGEKNE